MTCGVYIIENMDNGKSYIGSSIDTDRRWVEHIRLLKSGMHYNHHLQRSFDKHGPDKFAFRVLESCDENSVREVESRLIESMKPEYNIRVVVDGRIRFNHSDETRMKMSLLAKGRRPSDATIRASRKLKLKTWDGFVSPTGKEYRNITDLPSFCKQHGLRLNSMQRLGSPHLNEKYKTHRGWRSINNPEPDIRMSQSKTWDIVSPDGVEYRSVYNLSEFARQHGLGRGLVNLGSGASHYKGWRRLQ